MKTITLPYFDHDGTLTPIVNQFADKFTSAIDPHDATKIVLTLEDADADAFKVALPHASKPENGSHD